MVGKVWGVGREGRTAAAGWAPAGLALEHTAVCGR